MTLQEPEAPCADSAFDSNRGLCGKADPNIKPADDQIPEIGMVAPWKVVRALRKPGNSRPHSFIVRRGAFTTRIHHSQLTDESTSIAVHDTLDLMTIDIDTFDPEKPRPQLSQKGAFFASLRGQTLSGIVTTIAKYGVFVSSVGLPFCVKGLIHKSKLAGFNKVAALKAVKIGDTISFCIDDCQPHPDSARRVAGDWQVDCSQERAAYAEASRIVAAAAADANTVCATAVVAGRSHRQDGCFLVEVGLGGGCLFVARLKAPEATVLHKGDLLHVCIDSVDCEGNRPSADATFVART